MDGARPAASLGTDEKREETGRRERLRLVQGLLSSSPRDRQSGGRALDLPSWLAYLYAPLLPYLRRLKVVRAGPRDHHPSDILVPAGFAVEVVATDLNAPVHCCFDDAGSCYVTEAGHKIASPPRILKIDARTGAREVFFELPKERWVKSGAMTGATWHDGHLYAMNTDTLLRLDPNGEAVAVLTDLPGRGDHQANYPVVGPDGKLTFGVGSATNAGVVGPDNFTYEWLPKFPRFHDVPARDLTLVGRNFEAQNVLGNLSERVRTGAYVPFGTETRPGQVVPGDIRCTGAILRCNRDGTVLEVVAWGLRNPYGLAVHPDGRLFCTEHGIDERGARFIVGDYDDFYEIQPGAWYGWPDFASGVRLDDPSWGDGGQGREPVLVEPPDPDPPKPFVSFLPHEGSNGVDFCRDAGFGFVGDAFVALFGDLAPVTTPRLTSPRGFKVVRVDLAGRRVVDFAVNKIAGPASKLPHAGFERPSHCAFGPGPDDATALYVVDWGEIEIAPERGGVRVKQGTGTLWRIRRTEAPPGDRPPEPIQAPLYLLQYLALAATAAGLVGATVWLGRVISRVFRGRQRCRDD